MAWRVANATTWTPASPARHCSTWSPTIGGLHAQLMSSAELTAVGPGRRARARRGRQALWEERSLVKTWAMRGTLHLLPSAEYGLWQAALSTYRHFLKPSWSQASACRRTSSSSSMAGHPDALDGRQLTREELAAEVVDA